MTKTSFAHRRKSTTLERCQEAVRQSPENFEAHFNLGMAYSQHHCYDQALDAWQQAARLKPGNGFVRLNIGSLYAEQGRWEEARQAYQQGVELFRTAIQRFPDRVEGYYGLGMAYGHLNQYDLAMEAFELALLIQPDLADIHYGLAVACLEQGRHERAILALEETLRLDPKNARAQEYLNSACELRDRQAASPPNAVSRRAFSSSPAARRRRSLSGETSEPSLSQPSELQEKSLAAPEPEQPPGEDDAVRYMQSCTHWTDAFPLAESSPIPQERSDTDILAASSTQEIRQEEGQETEESRGVKTNASTSSSTEPADSRSEEELAAARSRVINHLVPTLAPEATRSSPALAARPNRFKTLLVLLGGAFLAGALLALYLQQRDSAQKTENHPSQMTLSSPKPDTGSPAAPNLAERVSVGSTSANPITPKTNTVPPLRDTASGEPPPVASTPQEEEVQKPESETSAPPPAPVKKPRPALPRKRPVARTVPARKTKADPSAYDKGVDALLNRLP